MQVKFKLGNVSVWLGALLLTPLLVFVLHVKFPIKINRITAIPTQAKIDNSLFSAADFEPKLSNEQMQVSQLCTQEQFDTELYKSWCDQIKQKPSYWRKQWEFVYIMQALSERGLLKEGMRGVGFGVGKEPLPALFAKYKVKILATDLNFEDAHKAGWVAGEQHLSLMDQSYALGIASMEQITKYVTTMDVDMRNIPAEIRGYDFTWSSCALEHLGSIEQGLEFIENSLQTLKPGGIAIHTTEYNLSSDVNTITTGDTVLYRKSDIKKLVKKLTAAGHEIYVNYNFGSGQLDQYIDLPPYNLDQHLKLQFGGYATTSIGLIIRKKL